jgi:DNA ligase-1
MESVIDRYNFEKLFGEDKNGKIKEWEICVENFGTYSDIVIKHGYVNKIETRRRVDKGKNLNKKNETTHFEQAISEASSKWKKKKEVELYKEINDKESPKESGVILPMLAQEFMKHNKKIKYPCYIQPKLDGYRMIYDSRSRKMTTRQGKLFEMIKYAKELFDDLEKIGEGIILDGELYIDGKSFEKLGVLRKKKLNEEDKKNICLIEYHVYDMISEKVFEERNRDLCELFLKNEFKKIKYVKTYRVNEKEIEEYHQKFTNEGFEGSMIRNREGLYKQKNRSYDLLKLKDFMDEEFEIIGFSYEKDTSNEDRNCVVWIIKVNEGIECYVRPKGEKVQRQELYEKCVKNFNEFKGRKLWTKFFDYTSDGNLRFPTTKTNDVSTYIRDEIL